MIKIQNVQNQLIDQKNKLVISHVMYLSPDNINCFKHIQERTYKLQCLRILQDLDFQLIHQKNKLVISQFMHLQRAPDNTDCLIKLAVLGNIENLDLLRLIYNSK